MSVGTRRLSAIALPLLWLTACSAPPPTDDPQLARLDGAPLAPLDFGDSVPRLFVFTTVDCPIANAYAPELQAIFRMYGDQVRCFLVHVDPDVTPDDARAHRDAYGFTAPILFDPQHVLVEHAGITITPEAALYTARGELAYRGRIDDLFPALGSRRRAPTQHDLRDALADVLAGRPVARPRTQAVGCWVVDLPR